MEPIAKYLSDRALDIWFHRFEDGVDIEGRCEFSFTPMSKLDRLLIEATVDYNSWVESEQGLALAASLSKDVVLAEGWYNARLDQQPLLTKFIRL